MTSSIRYARTADGVDIAFAVAGSGPPLLVFRTLISPDVDAEIADESRWRAAFLDLADQRTVVIWDYRGQGLSAPAETYTLDAAVLDVEAVAGEIQSPTFDVMAMVTPCHFALAYVARHPERARRLILLNPAAPGASIRTEWQQVPDISATHFREYADLLALRMFGWDRPEQARRFADRMKERDTAEGWAQFNASMETMDATPLASSVTADTLVLIDVNAPNSALVTAERQQYMRRLAALMPNAQLSIIKQGDGRAYVAMVRSFLGDPAPAPADTALPRGTAVILFADIVDSTAMTERIGDAAFRAKARELDVSLRSIITDAGGTAIDGKLLGDGVLATFPAAAQAIDAALRCGAAGDEQGLQLHLGIHAGDVIREANNVFGGAVNIASRISGLSAPDEVLVSATVRDLARTSAGVTFEDRGEHTLKGIDEPQRVFAVRAKTDK